MNEDKGMEYILSCLVGLFPAIVLWPMNGDATMETIAIATGIIVFFIVLVANYISYQINELKKLTMANINPPKEKKS